MIVLISALFAALPLADALTLDVGFPLTVSHVLSVPLAAAVAVEVLRRRSLVAGVALLPLGAFWLVYAASAGINLASELPTYEWATGRNAPGLRSITKVLWLGGNILIAAVIANALVNRARARAAIVGLLIGAGVTAAYGVYQVIGQSAGFYVPLIPGTEFIAGTPSMWIVPRAAATFLEPSFFGAYLGVTIPFAMVLVTDPALSRWKRVAAFATLTIIIAGIAVTFSVVGILTSAAAGVLLLLIRIGRDGRRLLLPACAAVLLAAAVLWTFIPGMTGAALALVGKGTAAADVVLEPGTDPTDPDGDGEQSEATERSAVERVVTSTAALAMFRDHPILGVGPGNFGFWFPQYRPPAVEQPDQLLITNNVYAELLAETGILGIGAFLVAGTMLLVTVAPGVRDRRRSARFQAAAVASIGAVAVSLILAPSFTVLYQWALIGLAIGVRSLREDMPAERAASDHRISAAADHA